MLVMFHLCLNRIVVAFIMVEFCSNGLFVVWGCNSLLLSGLNFRQKQIPIHKKILPPAPANCGIPDSILNQDIVHCKPRYWLYFICENEVCLPEQINLAFVVVEFCSDGSFLFWSCKKLLLPRR